MKKQSNREKAQVLEGGISIVVNIVLFAVKIWAGMVTGSIALVADAWHTLSDSLSSVFIIVAAKLASKKADKEHPFGHGRWELIAALLVAAFLAVIGYEFFTDSIDVLKGRESVMYGTLAIVVTVISIIAKELLAQYAFYLGRKHNNPAITADGWHHRTDTLSSVVVLIGIIVTKAIPGLWWMDGVLGLLCAVLIFYAAFLIMKETITKILGEEPTEEFINELTEEVRRIHNEDVQLHHVHIHNYITHKELTFHIMLDKDMSIEESHGIATVIEDRIQECFDMTATIHVEPLEPKSEPT